MALVPMKDILVPARAGGYALGAFEFWSLDSAQAVTQAAQKLGVPVILQNGQIEADHAQGYDKMRKLAEIAASQVDIPVALHLDHAETFEQVRQAVEAGYTSVMIDASAEPFEENVEITRRVVELAHPLGISVESELGVLAGMEAGMSRTEAEARQTDPDEAAAFVTATGIDCLAVAIGTAHGKYNYPPEINIPRLKKIAEKVSIPLVLHGGSDTPDEKVSEACRNGIAKVNVCTDFVASFGLAYTALQNEPGFKYNVPNLFTRAQAAAQELVLRKLKVFLAK